MTEFVKKIKGVKPVIIIALISLFVEIFVCNNNSFRIVNKNQYVQKNFSIYDCEIKSGEMNWDTGMITYHSENGPYLFIELTGIDTNIGTIYADFEIQGQLLNYTVCYTDETNEDYYRVFNREFVNGVEKTKYTACYFNGKSKKLILRMEDLPDGYTFSVKQIVINKTIPIDISLKRVLFLFIVINVLYGIRKIPFWISKEKNRYHNLILISICGLFLLIGVSLYRHSFGEQKLNLMYNVNFTDALINKKLALDIPVSEALKSMENPYDASVRTNNGIEYSWDTAFYKGNYFCYYGIVPALLFFVPYKLCTGNYLQPAIVVIITYCLYLIFLDLTVIRLIRYNFPKVPFSVEALLLVVLNAATNLFYFATEPSFYMMLYSVGLMFVTIGCYLLTIWYTQKESKILLFIGALNMALAVGCRPPLLFYTLLIIPFGIKVIGQKKKKCIADIIALMIPYLLIGTGLALYNYLRFDNIMEFGQSYQLTAQDQLHGRHSLKEIPILLWLSCFQPLNFSAVFPYVYAPSSANNFAGHFYTGDVLTSLFGEVPLLFIIFSPYLWKKLKENTSIFNYRVVLYSTVVGFVMLVMELLNAGVEWRYTSEIAPILCITVVIMICNVAQNLAQEKVIALSTILYACAVFSFIVTFLRGISGLYGYMHTYHPEYYYSLERLFSFWK